jgi:hypothetical protein
MWRTFKIFKSKKRESVESAALPQNQESKSAVGKILFKVRHNVMSYEDAETEIRILIQSNRNKNETSWMLIAVFLMLASGFIGFIVAKTIYHYSKWM